jgi:hypothetical protein
VGAAYDPTMRRNGKPVSAVPVVRRQRIRLEDPAYVADTPHDMWASMQRGEKFPSTRSAAQLEAYIAEGPGCEELLERGPLDRERYDGGGRLLARWMLAHYGRHPQDVRVAAVVRRELVKEHPEILVLGTSTAQWVWALAAANRVWDAHHEAE